MSIEEVVRNAYAAVATSRLSNEDDGVRRVAEAFGYSPEELASIPAEANMGLSCGNPIALASLRPGETVVDLGSGGGLDVFLAADRVGPAGKAIGIDMTPEMIERARRNAAGRPNVEFHLATIDKLPLADKSVDCVTSNCVINLAPDKGAVFREIARVLKPGGRLAVSDIALKQPLPAELGEDLMAYAGCIAGAISIEAYRRGLAEAGFAAVEIVDSGADLNAYSQVENQAGCCSPPMTSDGVFAAGEGGLPLLSGGDLPAIEGGRPVVTLSANSAGGGCGGIPMTADLHGRLGDLLARYNVNDYAASVKVFAVKPGD